ncbi:MAG TPA: diaminopimelate decarboxylase [Gaiellales bacterium]
MSELQLGGIPASQLAEEFGTPLYVYEEDAMRRRARAYLAGLEAYPGASRAAYACKANATVGVIAVLADEGLGADVASAGELAAARRAGVEAAAIIVHGNNKSDDDLSGAVAAEAGLVVVDHTGELDQLEGIAAAAGRVQPVLVRVTPGIDADTHHKIRTGHHGSKFGFAPPDALDALEQADSLQHLAPAGLHVHLGSQIRELGPYLGAVDWLVEFIEDNGLGELPVLDLGGGLGIAHVPGEIELEIERSVETICAHLTDRLIAHGLPMPELVLEPGRSIVGPAGTTLYRVGAVKQAADGTVYAAVDGGMSDNPRPALYDARYTAVAVARPAAEADHTYTIAGKHCESGDVLIEHARLPELAAGDLLAVPATGAYNASMASTYNLLPRPAAVMVAGGKPRLLQRRESVDDLLARDLA